MRKITIAATMIFLILTCLAAVSSAQNQVDLSFAAAPSITNEAFKQQIAQPDGKVIVWGGALTANGQIKGLVARLNTNGSVDTSFSFCNCNLSGVSTVALQSDGKLLVGGEKGFPGN